MTQTKSNAPELCGHKVSRELLWKLEMYCMGPEGLDRDSSWVPLDVVLKDIGCDSSIALHALKKFGLLAETRSWHPMLLKYGLFSVISYTESEFRADYEEQVEIVLLSKRGKCFLQDFLENSFLS